MHRFTRNGVTNARQIKLRPEVQIVMHMDGWGAPWLKRDSYKDYVVTEPVQYTGFKLFYHNDTKKGDPLMTPRKSCACSRSRSISSTSNHTVSVSQLKRGRLLLKIACPFSFLSFALLLHGIPHWQSRRHPLN